MALNFNWRSGILEWDSDLPRYIAFYPNFLSSRSRHWGFRYLPIDNEGHTAFGFWYFSFSWCVRDATGSW